MSNNKLHSDFTYIFFIKWKSKLVNFSKEVDYKVNFWSTLFTLGEMLLGLNPNLDILRLNLCSFACNK